MRHLFASRGTAAAFVGMLALVAAGGGYAVASGGATTRVNACIHRHGGGLYVAKTCAKGDRGISWNKVGPRGQQGPRGNTGHVGPQGPGATSINFTTNGSASPTPVAIGKAGPLTPMGACTTTGSGGTATTQFVLSYKGPALRVDGFFIRPDGSAAPYSVSAPATLSQHLGTVGPTSGQAAESAQLFVIPSGHAPFELTLTAVADGGSPTTGATADTCHLSVVITPVAAPSG
jgi:hypothetical protein